MTQKHTHTHTAAIGICHLKNQFQPNQPSLDRKIQQGKGRHEKCNQNPKKGHKIDHSHIGSEGILLAAASKPKIAYKKQENGDRRSIKRS